MSTSKKSLVGKSKQDNDKFLQSISNSRLTLKQRKFIEAYSQCFDYTQAARIAYDCQPHTANDMGYQVAQSKTVQPYLQKIDELVEASVKPSYLMSRFREKVEQGRPGAELDYQKLSLSALNGLSNYLVKKNQQQQTVVNVGVNLQIP